NFWDAAGPDGIPGFGDLDRNLDVKRMVSELFGEIEPAKAKPETAEFTGASGPSAEISETPSPSDDRPSQHIENAAPQQQMSEPAPAKKIARRHGGAMPERKSRKIVPTYSLKLLTHIQMDHYPFIVIIRKRESDEGAWPCRSHPCRWRHKRTCAPDRYFPAVGIQLDSGPC